MSDPSLDLIGERFWDGTVAVSEGRVYVARVTGELRAGGIDRRPVTTEVIGQRLWGGGSIAVSDGMIYLARHGELRRGRLTNQVTTTVIGPRLWDGSIAVAGNEIYLAQRGVLRRGTLDDHVTTEVIGRRLWEGSIAVDGESIYLARPNGELRRGVVSSNTQTQVIGLIPANSSIAIQDDVLYVAAAGRLYSGRLRETGPTCVDVFSPDQDPAYPVYRIPSIAASLRENELWAFAEARLEGSGDRHENILVMKRGDAQGENWGPLEVVVDRSPDSLMNPTVVTTDAGQNWLIFQRWPAPGVSDRSVRTFELDLRTKACREITSLVRRYEARRFYFSGPGLGIQLTAEERRGRILLPMTERIEGHYWTYTAYRDPGCDWAMGMAVTFDPEPNENQLIELADGRIYMNSRSDGGHRLTSISEDGGETWSALTRELELKDTDPQGCHAGLVRYGDCLAAYSHPSDPDECRNGRQDGRIFVTMDDCASWPRYRTFYKGPFGYSCLVPLRDGYVGCLFEAADGVIKFARIDMRWIHR